MTYRFIDPDKIKNLLFNDEKYIAEFCEAGVATIGEFVEHYRIHLGNRDMQKLRKAGHKVRPGAQMMGVEAIVDEYEQSKKLLQTKADETQLTASIAKMEEMCKTVQKELTHLAENQ